MKKDINFLIIAYDTIRLSEENGSQMVAVFFFRAICTKNQKKSIFFKPMRGFRTPVCFVCSVKKRVIA